MDFKKGDIAKISSDANDDIQNLIGLLVEVIENDGTEEISIHVNILDMKKARKRGWVDDADSWADKKELTESDEYRYGF